MFKNNLNQIISYIKSLYGELDLYEKFYLYSLSFFIFLVFITNSLPNSFRLYINILVTFCLYGFAFGFTIYLRNFYVQLKNYKITKVGFIVIHAIVLLLTAIASQNFIAISLGLPPQDFNLTFGLVSLALYPVVALMITSIILLVVSLYYLIALLVDGYKNRPLKTLVLKFCHLLGSLGLVFLISFIPAYIGKKENELGSLIKWFAYISDYQVLKNYPKLPSETRVRLHENGVYSVAKSVNGQVQIEVKEFPK
jgi:hypothetical protein